MAGLNITSVKFKCTDRTPMFTAGQRVSFAWRIHNDTSEGDYGGQYSEVYNAEFFGTVISEVNNGLRFIVRVDEKSIYYDFNPSEVFRNKNLIIKVKPECMKTIDEPTRSFCPACLAYDPEDAKGKCHGYDVGGLDRYIPYGCLRFTK